MTKHGTELIDLAEGASDREGILDALYRFGAGQDLKDKDLFESAFAEHAMLDFTGPAKLLGTEVPVFEGRRTIADIVMGVTAPLATSHTVTNPRILHLRGDRASLWCLVEAQHVSKAGPGRHLLLKNAYTVELVRGGRRWVITHMHIANLWMQGEPSVLFGGR